MDPITAFAACKAAYSTIQGAVAVYKDLKNTGRDVSGIVSEVGGALSNFVRGHDAVSEEQEKLKEQRKVDAENGKRTNVYAEAIENVIRLRQIRQFYKDLEHMVRWELGMPDLWTEIEQEKERLEKERAEQAERQRQERQKAAWRRRMLVEGIQDRLWALVAVLLLAGYMAALMMAIQAMQRSRSII